LELAPHALIALMTDRFPFWELGPVDGKRTGRDMDCCRRRVAAGTGPACNAPDGTEEACASGSGCGWDVMLGV